MNHGTTPQQRFESDDGDDWDRAGCFWSLLRFSTGALIIYVIMAFLIFAVAVVSLLLFR